ncbi:hypothetical protein MGWOODY_Clf2437 [hydrothermal vent metagenome]|uniref:Uncharacterized protein n=1 Tax=hydrothermal vent metagenome TaxID=652676 RepID=A0A160V8I2_9ZZZZ
MGSYKDWATRWSNRPDRGLSSPLRPLLLVTSVGELAMVDVGPEKTTIFGLSMAAP